MSLALICQNRRGPRNSQAGGYGKTWLSPIYVAGAFAFTNNWFQAGNKTHTSIVPSRDPKAAECGCARLPPLTYFLVVKFLYFR
jgi:hypothetical protein